MIEIANERVHWLWPGRLALGKLTIMEGDPGKGKSMLGLDLAARVSSEKKPEDQHCMAERSCVQC